jgi:hypothetical protein
MKVFLAVLMMSLTAESFAKCTMYEALTTAEAKDFLAQQTEIYELAVINQLAVYNEKVTKDNIKLGFTSSKNNSDIQFFSPTVTLNDGTILIDSTSYIYLQINDKFDNLGRLVGCELHGSINIGNLVNKETNQMIGNYDMVHRGFTNQYPYTTIPKTNNSNH